VSNCRNCGTERSGPYCAQCGQNEAVERLTLGSVLRPAADALFSLESRVWTTVAGLTRNPGKVAAEYVEGRRARYVHPLRYYVFVLAASAVVITVMGADPLEATQALVDTTIQPSVGADPGTTDHARDVMSAALGNALLVALPVLAGLLWLFFPRSGRNFAESNVLAFYAAGHAHLLGIVAFLFSPLAPEAVDSARRLIALVWLAWGTVVFYRAPRITGALRALSAVFFYLAVALGVFLLVAVLLS
jgi:hypothetical protein